MSSCITLFSTSYKAICRGKPSLASMQRNGDNRSYLFRVFCRDVLVRCIFKHGNTTAVSLFQYGIYLKLNEPGSSVNIASDYGLDDPGSNPGGDEIFRPSKPTPGPIQPPVKWVPNLSRG